MRIVHIINDLPICGNGVTNAAVDLALAQAKTGHRVAMASAGGAYESLLVSGGVSLFPLGPFGPPFGIWRSALQFRRLIREFKPDVVHCHGVKGMVLAFALRRLGRFALISHIHNVHNKSSDVMRLADVAVAVSAAVADDMHKRGIPRSKLRVVQNRFIGSLRRGDIKTQPAQPLVRPAIVTVAGMNKRKNIDGLIAGFNKIAAEFPAAHLYLVGDGPDRGEFERLAQASPAAERIHFEGFQEDSRSYMLDADVFVLVSHRDSAPLVINEAREAGAAIIASEVDGIPAALDGGAAGILVQPTDIDAIAGALRRLLSDPAERAAWQKAAKSGLEEHSLWRMHEEVMEVYSLLLRERNKSGSHPGSPVAAFANEGDGSTGANL